MGLKQSIVKVLNKLPYISGLKRDLSSYERWGLPGHFYNPIPDLGEVEKYCTKGLSTNLKEIKGIDFNMDQQIHLLKGECLEYYQKISFPTNKTSGSRYYFDNPNYSFSDAIFYFFIMNIAQPKRVIEIGSGFSSCAVLDANESTFENKIECTFIEPYPELLESLLKPEDKPRIKIIPRNVQEVDLSVFMGLQENDILFVDSSHVLKSGSDLNYILFEVIPHLPKGVYIHFHDIFYPFEYPKEWITQYHRAWNEIYALRSFLMYNNSFEIVLFNTLLENEMPDWFNANMPLCMKNTGGSIWLKKIF